MTAPEPPSIPASDSDARSNGPDRPSWLSWVIASAVAAVVVIAGVFFISRSDEGSEVVAAGTSEEVTSGSDQPQQGPAGPGREFGSGGSGEVTAVDGDTLTIEAVDPDGATAAMTIRTSGDTVVSEMVDGTVGDLSVGDDVVVMGEESESGVTARSISVGGGGFGGAGGPNGGGGPPEGFESPEDFEPPEGFEPPTDGERPPGGGGGVAVGELVAIDSATMTLQTDEGETVIVELAEDVTVRITEARSVSDIEVGDTIRAVGDTEGDEIQATEIVIGDLAFGPGGRGGFGGRPGTEG